MRWRYLSRATLLDAAEALREEHRAGLALAAILPDDDDVDDECYKLCDGARRVELIRRITTRFACFAASTAGPVCFEESSYLPA